MPFTFGDKFEEKDIIPLIENRLTEMTHVRIEKKGKKFKLKIKLFQEILKIIEDSDFKNADLRSTAYSIALENILRTYKYN